MIITLTPNPSIDATLQLGQPLGVGAVNRAESVSQFPGGKGVNVTHAARLAGHDTVAVFPAHTTDAFIALTDAHDIPFEAITMPEHVRVNTTITDAHGVTTKVNGPGPHLTERVQDQLIDSVCSLARLGSWVVMAGSLPQGVPADWYATAVTAVREAAPHIKIAVDTSDRPMLALGESLPHAAPDVIKPNGLELGQLTGRDGLALEAAAVQGDYSGVLEAAREVIDRGVQTVLVTLGAAGAVLVTRESAWCATPPKVTVQSTVGAGDSSLAGFILARAQGKSMPDALAMAVAYGSAAASLPGTEIPGPDMLNLSDTHISQL